MTRRLKLCHRETEVISSLSSELAGPHTVLLSGLHSVRSFSVFVLQVYVYMRGDVFASVFGDLFILKCLFLKKNECVRSFVSLWEKLQLKLTMLKEAFKDEAMGGTQVYQWFNHFKRGEMSVEDQLHCGRSSTSRTDKNVEKVPQAVLADCCRTIDDRSVMEFMPTYFNRRFDDEMGCCKIHSVSRHR